MVLARCEDRWPRLALGRALFYAVTRGNLALWSATDAELTAALCAIAECSDDALQELRATLEASRELADLPRHYKGSEKVH